MTTTLEPTAVPAPTPRSTEEYRRAIAAERYWCCGEWRTKRELTEHALTDLNLAGRGHRSADLPPDGRSCVR
jgi:hypothetical protein